MESIPGGQVCFTPATQPQPTSGATCAGTVANATNALSGDNYLDIVVPSGSITTDQWVQVRQDSSQPSDWSVAVYVSVLS